MIPDIQEPEIRTRSLKSRMDISTATYCEIQQIARNLMRREDANHTLQATALVGEAWLRILRRDDLDEISHLEFLQIAAQAMRRVLVDYAKAKKAKKRGGDLRKVTFDSAVHFGPARTDMADLDEALNRLADLNPRQASVVELRFFGGLTMEQVAELLGISKRTAESEWTFARAWLRKELEPEDRTPQM